MKKNIKKIMRTGQQKNIISSSAPVKRIIACPGSGKTYVLTQNIAEIIDKELCEPQEILAITFTKNAAENMRRKIKKIINKKIDYDAINIFTFNSFGNMIISENSFEMGLGSDYRLINTSKSWQILYSIIKQADFKKIKIGKDTAKFLNDVLLYIQDLKSNLISVNDLKEYINKRTDIFIDFASTALCRQELEILEYQQDLTMLYEEYENIKNSSNLVDYSDHMFKPYQLFLHNSNISSRYSKRYKYIFIDEFQDTDVAQAYLISMIYKSSACNITIVGDDDQGIYSFRGACVENILDFHKWECFSGNRVKDFFLTTNFRSGENIVNALQGIIAENKNRFTKDLKANPTVKDSGVFFSYYKTKDDEACNIAENIKLLLSYGFKMKDIAVISRRKNFKGIADALDKTGIKYELISSRGFFYEPEILFIISWLMLLHDIFNEHYLVYLLQSGKYAISDRDIFFLRNPEISCCKKTSKKNIPHERPAEPGSGEIKLIDSVLGHKNIKLLSTVCHTRLEEFIDEFNFYIRHFPLLKLAGLVNLIFEHSGLAAELRSGFSRAAKQKIKNVEMLIKISSDFEPSDYSGNIESFIAYLKDAAKTEEDDPETAGFSKSNSVKIMSIHAAKGLEFKAVFMPSLLKKDYAARSLHRQFKLPSLLRKDKNIYRDIKKYTSLQKFNRELKEFNIEEERRIFYVGCSRAAKYLFLSAADETGSIQANKSENRISAALPFIRDIVLNDIIIPLNDDGFEYLKEVFDHSCSTYFESFNKYIGQYNVSGYCGSDVWQKTENLKEISFFDRHLVKKSENAVSEMTGIIPFIKQKRKKSAVFPDNTVMAAYFESVPENIKQYIKMIKRSKYSGANKNFKITSAKKRHFSLTELLTYCKCPSFYKWKYIFNIPEPLRIETDTGLKVHRHIQVLTSIKFKDFMQDCMLPAVNADEKDYLEIIKKTDKEENVYESVKKYYESSIFDFPDVSEIKVEQLFYWNLEGFIISCKADRLDTTSGGSLRIIDYKTSASGDRQKENRYFDQLKAYTCGLSDIYKVPASSITSFLFYLKDGHILQKSFNDADLRSFSLFLQQAINSINSFRFEPYESRSCSKRCCYFGLCH